MTDRFEAQGEWWLPARPERRISGRLTFDPVEGTTLALIGSLRPWRERGTPLPDGSGYTFSDEDFDRSGAYPRIVGVANGHAFTLEDCFQTRLTSHLVEGGEHESIYVNQLLKGAQFEAHEEVVATAVSVRARHLATWVGESGLSVSYSLPDDDGRWNAGLWASISAKVIPDRSVTLADGTKITIGQVLGTEGSGIHAQSLTQDFCARFDVPAPQPLSMLIEHASALQSLVSFATGRYALFQSVEFFHPDVSITPPGSESSPPRSIQLPIEYFVRWRGADKNQDDEPVARHDLLFDLTDIGGMAAVERWCSVVERHRTAIARVVGTKFVGSMDVNDRVLSRAAALESFDRVSTATSQSKFTARISRCIDFAGEPFLTLIGDVNTWVEVLRRERDDMAHHFGNLQLGGPETLYLSESAYWLFLLCLFRAAAFPDDVFDRIGEHRQFQWLRQRIPTILT